MYNLGSNKYQMWYILIIFSDRSVYNSNLVYYVKLIKIK